MFDGAKRKIRNIFNSNVMMYNKPRFIILSGVIVSAAVIGMTAYLVSGFVSQSAMLIPRADNPAATGTTLLDTLSRIILSPGKAAATNSKDPSSTSPSSTNPTSPVNPSSTDTSSTTTTSPTTQNGTPPATQNQNNPQPSPTGRSYPWHTNINATTFWVGEQFQSTADGSQVCSAYDARWQYSFFHLSTGTNTTAGCKGSPTGGCDAVKKSSGGKCDDTNSTGSLRTPSNGYFPAGLPPIYESPFYLDLPYDDYNPSDSTDTTGYATRCRDIPWANDAGFSGNCTNKSFSYMKNRFVKITAHGNTCYGQIEDAGPADDGNGNGNYADANYVFSTSNARPYNKSYNSAGMDISPALGACLGGQFNSDLTISWQFVDGVDVPAGPWKTIVTTTKPN